jgi:hypothetical protein
MSARDMFSTMDWQQIAALLVVAIAAALLLRGRFRRRRFSFQRDTHCGCSSPGAAQKSSIVFHARKGEEPRTIVKMK